MNDYLGKIVALTAIAIFLLAPSALAVEPSPLEMVTEDERIVRWHLSADSVVSHNDEEILEAKGNVFLRHGNEHLKADFARYYSSTNWVFLKGNVEVTSGNDVISAEEAEFDLRSRVGWLKKGKIFIAGPNAHIYGEHIDKHWGDVYTFKEVKITACDNEVPAWSISSDEATVEIDGYAHMKGSVFHVKDVPVAYSPAFLYPVKTSRQTGLLKPEFGRSTVKGAYYNQPFFWAINESSDLTANLEFMEKRGWKPGLEYRTRPNSTTAGWLRMDWFRDKLTNTRDDKGKYQGDGLVRSNEDRWWLRGMFDSKMEDTGWRLKADLDLVSDQYYLSEIKSDLSGFNRSRDEMYNLFRRDLMDKSRNRKSGAVLTHEWERVGINLSTFYEQNPRYGHGNRPRSQDATVQSLPQFDAFLYQGRIFPSFPLEVDASFQAAYKYRKEGTKGTRYGITPRLTMPLSSKYGSIIASGGFDQRVYNTSEKGYSYLNQNREGHGPRQTRQDSMVPFFNIAAQTDFARVYDLGSSLTDEKGDSQWTALRHSIQPKVEYRYRPSEDQERTPYYDAEDRIEAQTDLVYSITNVLTRKRERTVLEKDESGEMVATSKTDYIDLLRLRIEQSYNHREATRNHQRDEYGRRPFGDIIADLEIGITPYLSLNTRNNWSPYLNELTRHQSGVRFSYPKYGYFYVGYDHRPKLDEYLRQRKSDVKYLKTAAYVDLWGPFTLEGNFNYDIVDAKNHETNVRLSYNHQCFSLVGGVFVDPREETYSLNIILMGLE